MARYFFNLENGTLLPDEEGEECAGLLDAKEVAIVTAEEYGRNRSDAEIKGRFVCVTDESGAQVFRTPLVNTGRK